MRRVVRAGERDRNRLAGRPRHPTKGIVHERDGGVTATVTVRGCGGDRGGERRMMAPGDVAPGLPVVAATPMRISATATWARPLTRSGHRQDGNRGDEQDSEQERSEALHSGRLCMVCFVLSIAPEHATTVSGSTRAAAAASTPPPWHDPTATMWVRRLEPQRFDERRQRWRLLAAARAVQEIPRDGAQQSSSTERVHRWPVASRRAPRG
jgi:hypothetical protein